MTDVLSYSEDYAKEQKTNGNQPLQMKASEEKKLLSKLDGWYNHCTKARVNFERQWYYNMAFYFGRQWVQWVGNTTGTNNFTRLVEPAAPNWRVRLVTNKIRRYVRTELTKLNKEKTQWFVQPKTTEDVDLAAARAAEQISEYLFDVTKFDVMKRRSTFWMLLLGTSFLKTSYSDDLDPSGVPGKVVLDAVNAFHLLAPDLQEEEIEGQPYLIHTSTKSPAWVKRTFGMEMQPDVSAGSNSLEQKFLNALSLKSSENSQYCYVKEAWVKPGADDQFPDGALITWAGPHVLAFYDAWPYKDLEFPFAKMDHIPTGRFYADSVIVDLIPVQKEVNRTKSQLVEAKNRMARPQFVAPKGSVDANKVTSEPGLIIFYQPGFQPPVQMNLTNMPQYVIEELDRNYRDMDDLAGQYEITKGRTPPGVEAASAIAYLQEENDTLLLASVSSIEEAIEKVGRQMLGLVDQYWDLQRTITVAGENNTFETYLFSKENVAGNTDFKVESGSSIPRSRAAKQAFLMELAERGFITGDKLLRYLDMMETNRLFDESQVSIRQAQRENIKMRMTPPVPQTPQLVQPGMPQQQPEIQSPVQVNLYDDHIEHINTHSLYMRSQQYENLDPQIKNVFMQHLQQHIQAVQSGQGVDQLLRTAPPVPQGPPQGQPPPQPQDQQPAG